MVLVSMANLPLHCNCMEDRVYLFINFFKLWYILNLWTIRCMAALSGCE